VKWASEVGESRRKKKGRGKEMEKEVKRKG
jgi:hypothetical protein